MPRPALEHPSADLTREHEGRRQIHLDDRVPALVVVLGRRSPRDRARVDQDVDWTVGRGNRGGERANLVPALEVDAECRERAARSLDAVLHLAAGRFELRARPDHVGAGLGEHLGHREPDAAAAAGDERELAGQVEQAGRRRREAHSATPAPQSMSTFIARPASRV